MTKPKPDPRRNVEAGLRHEERLARKIGGRRIRGSGAVPGRKGDLEIEDDVWQTAKVENKTSIEAGSKSFSIKKEWLEKISLEALAHGHQPLAAFEILGMERVVSADWALVPIENERAMKRILSELAEERRGGRKGLKKKPRSKKEPKRKTADFFNRELYRFLNDKGLRDGEERASDNLLHVSDLYKMCPFKEILDIALGKTGRRKREKHGADSQLNFDHGNMTHEWWQNRWLGPMGYLWGRWKCSRCEDVVEGLMPEVPCECSEDHPSENGRCHPRKCLQAKNAGKHDRDCRLCIAEGSMVSAEAGLMPIEELKIGDLVYTHTGKLRRVLAVAKKRLREYTVALTVQDVLYPLFLTPDHQVIAPMKGRPWVKVEARSLRPGQKVYRFFEGNPVETEVAWVGRGCKPMVYDIQVETDETFFAGEILVSNCRLWGNWEFDEIPVLFKDHGVIGSSDGLLLNFPGDHTKKRIFDLKTKKGEWFKRMHYPDDAHLAQISLYGHGLDVKSWALIYICKGDISEPPKSFRGDVDEAQALELLDKAKAYWDSLLEAKMPERMCLNKDADRARRCQSRKHCFSRTWAKKAEANLKKLKDSGHLEWAQEALEKLRSR